MSVTSVPPDEGGASITPGVLEGRHNRVTKPPKIKRECKACDRQANLPQPSLWKDDAPSVINSMWSAAAGSSPATFRSPSL